MNQVRTLRSVVEEGLDKYAGVFVPGGQAPVVDLMAGLQFALANPAVVAVIRGASRPSRIAEDRTALDEFVPGDFWLELRKAGLVYPEAPLPIDIVTNRLQSAGGVRR
jgi:D-threo-aldose 1-dehydrogenase